jgi:hypothetical protein
MDDPATADALVSVTSSGSGSIADRLFVADSIGSLSTTAPNFGLQLSSSSAAAASGAIDIGSQYQYQHPHYVTPDGGAMSFDVTGSAAAAAAASSATGGRGSASAYPSAGYSSSSSRRLPVRLTDYQQPEAAGLVDLPMDSHYIQVSNAVSLTVESAGSLQSQEYGF